jgi:hypothetical protein
MLVNTRTGPAGRRAKVRCTSWEPARPPVLSSEINSIRRTVCSRFLGIRPQPHEKALYLIGVSWLL